MEENLPENQNPEEIPKNDLPPEETLSAEKNPQTDDLEKEISPPNPPHFPAFFGEGSKFFVIQIVNFLLTVVSLGFYYPWAKASKLQYLYQEIEFAGSRFTFHGTGKEMFVGYLKALFLGVLIYGFYYYFSFSGYFFAAIAVLLAGFMLIYPLAIHGSIKYRFSRTSWRGIFFGYRGELSEMFYKCFLGGFLTLITFGIYSFWLRADIRKYIVDNLRLGDVEFEYRGEGVDLFVIAIKYFALMFAFYIAAAIFVVIGALIFGVSLGNFGKGNSAPNTGGMVDNFCSCHNLHNFHSRCVHNLYVSGERRI